METTESQNAIKTFSEYEQIALESKKMLFDLYIQEQAIELEYQNKGGIQSGIEVYKWRSAEKQKIEMEFKNQSHRRLFLEAWNKGDFANCDYHIDRF